MLGVRRFFTSSVSMPKHNISKEMLYTGLSASTIAVTHPVAQQQQHHLSAADAAALAAAGEPPRYTRSMLFLKNENLTQSKFRLLPVKPDWFILDVEDNVPPPQKPYVRALLKSMLDQGKFAGMNNVAVRINSIEGDLKDFKQDIAHIVHRDIRALILAKLKDLRMLHMYEDLVADAEKTMGLPPGHTKFWVNLESPEGVLNGPALVKGSDRNIGVCFGHADYLAALGANDSSDALYTARALTVMAGRTRKLSVVDTPYLNLTDSQGLYDASLEARALGFTGKFALHPSQLVQIHRVFTPSAAEVAQAREIERISQAGVHADSGLFVGPPHQLRARDILATHTAIAEQEAKMDNLFKQDSSNKDLLRVPKQTHHAFLRRPLVQDGSTAAPAVGAEKSATEAAPKTSNVTKMVSPSYGADPSKLKAGQTFQSPYEITITEGQVHQWHQNFLAVNRIGSSKPFAQAYGLKSTPAPFDFLLNLCMGMSVDPYSESCRLHLGLYNCTNQSPVYVGDTISNTCAIVSVGGASSDGRFRVVDSKHQCFNQNKELVFSMFKRSLFDASAIKQHASFSAELAVDPKALNAEAPLISQPFLTTVTKNHPENNTFSITLQPGTVIAHASARPIGVSENLQFCNFMRNTHSLHFDYARFKPNEVLVSGGYIMSTVLSICGRDLREWVYQDVVATQHMGKVRCMEPLSAMTYVKSVKPLGDTGFEQVLLKTVGMKNVNVHQDLSNQNIPVDVMEHTGWNPETFPKPAQTREMFENALPQLRDRMVMQIVWRVVRPRHA